MLRGKFIAIQAYLKKQEKSQINHLTLHLKQQEKEEMKSPSISRRKEILKITAEINAKETKETIAKNQLSQKLVLWERLIRKQKEKNQINKNRNEEIEQSQQTTQKYKGS